MRDAEQVWSVVKNPKNTKLKMPFDAFLKLWQLKKPNLFKLEKVDCIMVDEGQDMSGAMLDIFLTHPGSRIIVGDPHQQIYSWSTISASFFFVVIVLGLIFFIIRKCYQRSG